MKVFNLLLRDPDCGTIVAIVVASTVEESINLFDERLRVFGLGDMPLEEDGRDVEVNVVGGVSERSSYMEEANLLAFDPVDWQKPDDNEEATEEETPEDEIVDPKPHTLEQAVLTAVQNGKNTPAKIIKAVQKGRFKHTANNSITRTLSKLKHEGVLVNPSRGVWEKA